MKLFRTILGIDPSGGRLAIVAVRAGIGRPAIAFPPVLQEPKAEKEPLHPEKAEGILGDYVARHGLVGGEAVLVIPVERVYIARTALPPLKDKDLREAAGLELERLFPVPPDTLRFAVRRLPASPAGGKTEVVVAAVPSLYLDQWEEVVGRTGLTISAAVPAPWAASAAISRAGVSVDPGRPFAFLRGAGPTVECAVFSMGEPVYCASRSCPSGSAPEEGLSLALSALADLTDSAGDGQVDLFAPSSWYPGGDQGVESGGIRFRLRGDFVADAGALLSVSTGEDGGLTDPFRYLGAFGAALPGERMDLLAPERGRTVSGIARTALAISAAAVLALGIAWPATISWKAKEEVRILDARVAALQPFVRQFEESLSDLDEAQGRAATLVEEKVASGETLQILKELTDRLPNGTWLLSLRVEGRKVELEGLSPSASEIFPALMRDGRFRSVEFGAPITRQADNIERFKIRGEYVPAQRAAASPSGPGAAR